MLYKMDAKLKEIFHLNKKIPFGGIGVMLVGDLLQIPPVTGSYIFSEPKMPKNKVSFEIENIWECFEPWILKHNHRQGAEGQWATILNRFREGIVLEADLNILQERETDELHHDLDAMHLAYSNKETLDHSENMLLQLETRSNAIEAVKFYPKGRKPFVKPDGRIEDLNVLDVLTIKVGARVVMVFNVNSIDDLVNGSTGTIIGLEYDSKNNVECIIVRFDKESSGQLQRARYPKYTQKYKKDRGTPVFREQMEVMGKTKCGKNLGMGSNAKIQQFPLIVNYASTNHKIQVSKFTFVTNKVNQFSNKDSFSLLGVYCAS